MSAALRPRAGRRLVLALTTAVGCLLLLATFWLVHAPDTDPTWVYTFVAGWACLALALALAHPRPPRR